MITATRLLLDRAERRERIALIKRWLPKRFHCILDELLCGTQTT